MKNRIAALALVRETKALLNRGKTASGKSLNRHLANGLTEILEQVTARVQREFPDYVKFGETYEIGPLNIGVSAEVKDEGKALADVGLECTWNWHSAPSYPGLIRLWGTKSGKVPLSTEFAFKIGESPGSVAARLGPSVVKALDRWAVSAIR